MTTYHSATPILSTSQYFPSFFSPVVMVMLEARLSSMTLLTMMA